MESVTVDINGISDMKRAIKSAKDVLHGIPRHEEEERPVSVKICAQDTLPVHKGPSRVLPAGEYLVDDIKYKYVSIRHRGEQYKVVVDNAVNQIKVLKGKSDG